MNRRMKIICLLMAMVLFFGIAFAENLQFELPVGLQFGMTAEEAMASQQEAGIEIAGAQMGERIYYTGDGAGVQVFGQDILYVGFRTHDAADALQYVTWEFSDTESYDAVAEALEQAYGPLNDITADGKDIMYEAYTGNLKADDAGNYRQAIDSVFSEELGMVATGFAMYLIPSQEGYVLAEHCQFHVIENGEPAYPSHYVSFLLLSDEAVAALTRDGLIK